MREDDVNTEGLIAPITRNTSRLVPHLIHDRAHALSAAGSLLRIGANGRSWRVSDLRGPSDGS